MVTFHHFQPCAYFAVAASLLRVKDKDPGVQAEAWSSLRAFQTCGTAKIMVALARSNRLVGCVFLFFHVGQVSSHVDASRPSRQDDGTRKRLVKTMRSLLIPATPDEISETWHLWTEHGTR